MTKAAGINVGKANLHVSASGGPVVRFDNAATDITKLLKHLHNPDTVPVVCGPTGGHQRRLPSRPCPSETAVRVDHTGRARAFAETSGYEAKTGLLDAQMLARHSEVIPEAETWEPVTDLHRQEMKDPLRWWRQFIDQRVQAKGRLDRGVSATYARSTQPHIASLEEEIARLDPEYQAVLEHNPILAEPVDLYPTVPRVGSLTTATLVAHLAELGLSHSKALTSLVGLAPWFRGSGKRQGDRAAKGGRGLVRRAFYMWARAVVRHDGEMRRFYDRLRQRGKPSNVAVVLMMRQSLLQLNTQHACSAGRHVACRSESPGCAASASAKATIPKDIGSGSERISWGTLSLAGIRLEKSDAWPLDAPATQVGNFETLWRGSFGNEANIQSVHHEVPRLTASRHRQSTDECWAITNDTRRLTNRLFDTIGVIHGRKHQETRRKKLGDHP